MRVCDNLLLTAFAMETQGLHPRDAGRSHGDMRLEYPRGPAQWIYRRAARTLSTKVLASLACKSDPNRSH